LTTFSLLWGCWRGGFETKKTGHGDPPLPAKKNREKEEAAEAGFVEKIKTK